MPRASLAFLLLPLLLVACSPRADGGEASALPAPGDSLSSGAPAETVAYPASGTASGPAAHDAARALAHLEALAKAPRVSGTGGEAAAARYIAEAFAAVGYDAEVRAFTFEGDRFRAGSVTLNGTDVEALTMAGSPGGEVSAPSAYVGLADAEGIAGKDLAGRVAVADRGGLNFGVKYENVRAAGAVGLVVVNNVAGPFSGNLAQGADFPVVAVSQEDGVAVRAAATRGLELAIAAPPTIGATVALNVVAAPPGDGRCEILVGGHFDSVPAAPGANDNASGTANVLELARAAAADGLDSGLCFAAFGAEESGLYGSAALAAGLAAEGALPRYMLNLDVTGIGDDVEVIGTSGLARRAIEAARAAGIAAAPSTLPSNSGSDHMSFDAVGVETVFFTSGEFAAIHTPDDVAAAVDPGMLDRSGDAAYALLRELLAEVAAG